MKLKITFLLLLSVLLFSCKDDTAERLIEQKKEAKKKQKVITIKEIKLSVKIAANDVAYKVKHAREFLEEGNHVKFRVFLKGREQSTPDLGVDVLNKVWPMVEDIASRDKEPILEGRFVNMLVVPKKH